jgi:hypothetical protein
MNKSYGTLCKRAQQNGADLAALRKQAGIIIGQKSPHLNPIMDVSAPTRFQLAEGKVTFTKNVPLPRNFVIENMLVAGKVAVLAGFGGVSKTQLSLNISDCVARGDNFCGNATKQGKSILVLAEEDQAEAVRRIQADIRYHNKAAQPLSDNVLVFGKAGEDVRLTLNGPSGNIPTSVAQELIDLSHQLENVKLIVLDHIGLFHGGDFNAREDAALTMRVATHIAKETCAAVIILAHSPKSSINDNKSSASQVFGSTAFVDQARAAWVMATMRDEEAKQFGVIPTAASAYVSLTVVKSNYTPTGAIHWFKRESFDDVGLLIPVNLVPPTKAYGADFKAKKAIISVIAKYPAKYSKTRLRDLYSGKKDDIGLSKGKFELTVDALIDEGIIRLVEPTNEQRLTHGLRKQVKHVLVLGDADEYM